MIKKKVVVREASLTLKILKRQTGSNQEIMNQGTTQNQKYKILFVDTERKVLATAKKIFSQSGYQIEVCDGAMRAADMVANNGPIAVVFTDERMRGMRGTELLEIVKRVSPNTVRVLTAAQVEDHVVEDIINKAEVYRFIRKPVDFNVALKVAKQGVSLYEQAVRNEQLDLALHEMEAEKDKVVREAAGLTARINKLKRSTLYWFAGILLVIGLGFGFNFYQEYLRQQDLQASSNNMGNWIAYKNHTALDTVNNLMWMTRDFRNIEKRYPTSWQEAMDWAQKMNARNYAGYSDWRVPTVAEYKSIFDPDRTKLAFDGNQEYPVGYPKPFEGGGGYGFWTSERVGEDSAKYFFFVGGYGRTEALNYGGPTMSVRLVRNLK
ncbi:Lcl domain-containing protein [Nitrospina sp. 32_T5]